MVYQALPGGVTPDFALWLTLAVGFRWGAAGGTSAGLWAGALVGALRGVAGTPVAFLYGLVGWLAGLHAERTHQTWTYPAAAMALVILFVTAEAELSRVLMESQPSLNWMLKSIGWQSIASLAFFGWPRSRAT